MNKEINEILSRYTAGEADLAETNAGLKEAGADFHLSPEKNPAGGWTEAELAEGFLPGAPEPPKPDRPDMGRCIALAGQTAVQECRSGRCAVTYDADGYADKAVKR